MDTKKLRQKILDLAIRGKLVSQDPNDEPASLLLKRIRAKKEHLIKEGKIKRSRNTVDTVEIEVPFEVPESWEWTTIGGVCEVARGGSPRPIKDYLTNADDGINWIKIGDTEKDGKYINSAQERIKPEGKSKSRYVHKGDFLLTNSMSFGHPYILNIDGCIHDGWLVISPIGNAFTADFLYYLLSSDFVYEQFSKAASGGVVSNLNSDKVADTIIPIPPTVEQIRIVLAIKQWFDLIDILENEKNDLQASILQAKSKILDLAIHGKLVLQDPKDEPAIELLKRINPKFEACENEIDTTQLPNSWCWTTLGSLFNHNTGKALNKSDLQEGSLLPYITTSNVYWNRFDLSEIKKMFFKDSEIDKCTVAKGDLLVCEGGDIGRSAIWGYDYDICIQNHIHRLRAKGDVSHLLYLYVLMFYKWTDKIRGKGIGLQGLSSGLLDKMVVPLPPYQEQLRIVAKIEELFSVLDSIKESLE